MYSDIVFYPASFFILLFAVLTLICKNIFYSLLSAICVFFITAVLFFILGSEYNAIIQLTLYGFAVPIILGLAIMFTDTKKKENNIKKGINSKYIMFLTCGIFILALIYTILISSVITPDNFKLTQELSTGINSYSNFKIFTTGLYVKYVFAFELISLILTITAVCLTMLKYKSRGER